MRKRTFSYMNFMFLIPLVLLSVMVWRDYNHQITTVAERQPELREISYLDNGKQIIGIADAQMGEDARVYWFDATSGNLIHKRNIPANSNSLYDALSYQQGKVIVPTFKDNTGLQLHALGPSGEMDELAQSTLTAETASNIEIYEWRGRLIITGERGNSGLYLAQVKDGLLTTSSLEAGEQFPARPLRFRELYDSFENEKSVPMFDVTLKDDSFAYISGILDGKGKPAVLLQSEEETSFEAEDRAGIQFAKHFAYDATKLVRVDSRYPGQAHLFNAVTQDWGAVLPTPKPVYQAKVILLNDREVLVAGSSTEDELSGSLLGYVYNEQTGQFTDASPLFKSLSYEELTDDRTRFFKEAGSAEIYFSVMQGPAGVLDLTAGTVQTQRPEQVQYWMIPSGKDRISLASFWDYLRQGNALVINWLIWLLLPIFLFGGMALLFSGLKRSHSRKVASGQRIQGAIIGMEETGTYINEQPQIRFTVRFTDEGRAKEVAIKKVISFLDPVKIGDPVWISYNRAKNKAVFVTGEQQEGEQEEMTLLADAVLRHIDEHSRIGHSRVLLLSFAAGGRNYKVPVLEPAGFEYRIGERANLTLAQGVARIYSYGNTLRYDSKKQLTLPGEVIRVSEYPVTVDSRKLMLLETVLQDTPGRIGKINSLFVPSGFNVQPGTVLPVIMRREDLEKELRLQRGKQGAAIVTSVRYEGTLGERPLAVITAERGGDAYSIYQTIEPLYGVAAGDELWIAYDENSREAIIINYSSQ
ncbi:hypothetical protein [Paenibacillus sp. NFR01]|uniref:hypothetical protein n=1 Tax=Paenibacillus sp. NFR01 TaxID=1566279 RepID=UPI0008BE7850|nr:hypothetical protein [Paenibacillus sp. NFR01]SET24003.1 hypothetical protein SAMN03159358_1101 [Paenibacillus sp. NFR01]